MDMFQVPCMGKYILFSHYEANRFLDCIIIRNLQFQLKRCKMSLMSDFGNILFSFRKFLFSFLSHRLLSQSLPASQCFKLTVFTK